MTNKAPIKTKERIEFENFVKSARVLEVKANMADQGVDLSKISRQTLDEIIRLIDRQTDLSREIQEKQRHVQVESQQIQAEIAGIATKAEGIIDLIMKEQEIGVYAKKAEAPKETVPESQ